MCVTGNKYVDLAIGVAAVAVTAGAAAPAVVPAVGLTAFQVGVGAALGATTSAALGRDPLMGALVGGVTAGVVPGADNIVTTVGYGGLGALAFDTVMPKPVLPDYSGYTPASQQFNSQQIATTGSGGRQATASLAEAIKRSKQRKLSQADVGDLSIDTSAFASTGLQLA